jgi:outer membrane murein-binding lipoprotein Lpp
MEQLVRSNVIILVLLILGCSDDARLAELAEECNRQQAQQNQEMAKLNREVAAGSKEVIQASTHATDKLLSMEKQIHDDRTTLEIERGHLAEERKSESQMGGFLVTATRLFAISLPLLLAAYLLHFLQKEGDPAISDLLIDELDTSGDDEVGLSESAIVSQYHSENQNLVPHRPDSNTGP